MIAEALESLLGFEIGVERELVGAVDIGFLHLGESRIEVHGAELMDFVIRSGGLTAELIAGNIQNLKSLVMVLAVHLLDGRILGGEAAAGGSIDHHDDLALVIRKVQLRSGSGGDGVIVNHVCFLHSVGRSGNGREAAVQSWRLPVTAGKSPVLRPLGCFKAVCSFAGQNRFVLIIQDRKRRGKRENGIFRLKEQEWSDGLMQTFRFVSGRAAP